MLLGDEAQLGDFSADKRPLPVTAGQGAEPEVRQVWWAWRGPGSRSQAAAAVLGAGFAWEPPPHNLRPQLRAVTSQDDGVCT